MNYRQEPWFGTIEQKTENRTFFDYLTTIHKKPLCMLQHVSKPLLRCINESRVEDPDIPMFLVGQWVLTSGSCLEGITIHPPFKDMASAMDFARVSLGVNNFYQHPVEGVSFGNELNSFFGYGMERSNHERFV